MRGKFYFLYFTNGLMLIDCEINLASIEILFSLAPSTQMASSRIKLIGKDKNKKKSIQLFVVDKLAVIALCPTYFFLCCTNLINCD